MSKDDAIKVILDKCTGCTLCIKVCPFDAIKMEEKKAVIDLAKCTLCGACVDVCKFDAIILQKPEKKEKIDFSAYKDVWVFCEQKKSKVQSVAYELLGKGKELAPLDTITMCDRVV